MRYTDPMETTKTYTRQEVADMLKVSLSTVGLMVSARRIYHIRVGRAIRIPEFAVEDYIAGRAPAWPADPLAQDSGEADPTPSLFTEMQGQPLRAQVYPK